MHEYYVYRFLNKKNEVIYVGSTKQIIPRMQQHFSKKGHLPRSCYEETVQIQFMTCKEVNDMRMKEIYYIGLYRPKYNTLDNENVTVDILTESNDQWFIMQDFEKYTNGKRNLKTKEKYNKTIQLDHRTYLKIKVLSKYVYKKSMKETLDIIVNNYTEHHFTEDELTQIENLEQMVFQQEFANK